MALPPQVIAFLRRAEGTPGPFIALDFETTAVKPGQKSALVEVGAALFNEEGNVDDTLQMFVRPSIYRRGEWQDAPQLVYPDNVRDNPAFQSGRINEQALSEQGRTVRDAMSQLGYWMGQQGTNLPIVAHNIAMETSWINHIQRDIRATAVGPSTPWIDTLAIMRERTGGNNNLLRQNVYPGAPQDYKFHALENLTGPNSIYYPGGIKPPSGITGGPHGALHDAVSTGMLYKALYNETDSYSTNWFMQKQLGAALSTGAWNLHGGGLGEQSSQGRVFYMGAAARRENATGTRIPFDTARARRQPPAASPIDLRRKNVTLASANQSQMLPVTPGYNPAVYPQNEPPRDFIGGGGGGPPNNPPNNPPNDPPNNNPPRPLRVSTRGFMSTSSAGQLEQQIQSGLRSLVERGLIDPGDMDKEEFVQSALQFNWDTTSNPQKLPNGLEAPGPIREGSKAGSYGLHVKSGLFQSGAGIQLHLKGGELIGDTSGIKSPEEIAQMDRAIHMVTTGGAENVVANMAIVRAMKAGEKTKMVAQGFSPGEHMAMMMYNSLQVAGNETGTSPLTAQHLMYDTAMNGTMRFANVGAGEMLTPGGSLLIGPNDARHNRRMRQDTANTWTFGIIADPGVQTETVIDQINNRLADKGTLPGLAPNALFGYMTTKDLKVQGVDYSGETKGVIRARQYGNYPDYEKRTVGVPREEPDNKYSTKRSYGFNKVGLRGSVLEQTQMYRLNDRGAVEEYPLEKASYGANPYYGKTAPANFMPVPLSGISMPRRIKSNAQYEDLTPEEYASGTGVDQVTPAIGLLVGALPASGTGYTAGKHHGNREGEGHGMFGTRQIPLDFARGNIQQLADPEIFRVDELGSGVLKHATQTTELLSVNVPDSTGKRDWKKEIHPGENSPYAITGMELQLPKFMTMEGVPIFGTALPGGKEGEDWQTTDALVDQLRNMYQAKAAETGEKTGYIPRVSVTQVAEEMPKAVFQTFRTVAPGNKSSIAAMKESESKAGYQMFVRPDQSDPYMAGVLARSPQGVEISELTAETKALPRTFMSGFQTMAREMQTSILGRLPEGEGRRAVLNYMNNLGSTSMSFPRIANLYAANTPGLNPNTYAPEEMFAGLLHGFVNDAGNAEANERNLVQYGIGRVQGWTNLPNASESTRHVYMSEARNQIMTSGGQAMAQAALTKPERISYNGLEDYRSGKKWNESYLSQVMPVGMRESFGNNNAAMATYLRRVDAVASQTMRFTKDPQGKGYQWSTYVEGIRMPFAKQERPEMSGGSRLGYESVLAGMAKYPDAMLQMGLGPNQPPLGPDASKSDRAWASLAGMSKVRAAKKEGLQIGDLPNVVNVPRQVSAGLLDYVSGTQNSDAALEEYSQQLQGRLRSYGKQNNIPAPGLTSPNPSQDENNAAWDKWELGPQHILRFSDDKGNSELMPSSEGLREIYKDNDTDPSEVTGGWPAQHSSVMRSVLGAVNDEVPWETASEAVDRLVARIPSDVKKGAIPKSLYGRVPGTGFSGRFAAMPQLEANEVLLSNDMAARIARESGFENLQSFYKWADQYQGGKIPSMWYRQPVLGRKEGMMAVNMVTPNYASRNIPDDQRPDIAQVSYVNPVMANLFSGDFDYDPYGMIVGLKGTDEKDGYFTRADVVTDENMRADLNKRPSDYYQMSKQFLHGLFGDETSGKFDVIKKEVGDMLGGKWAQSTKQIPADTHGLTRAKLSSLLHGTKHLQLGNTIKGTAYNMQRGIEAFYRAGVLAKGLEENPEGIAAISDEVERQTRKASETGNWKGVTEALQSNLSYGAAQRGEYAIRGLTGVYQLGLDNLVSIMEGKSPLESMFSSAGFKMSEGKTKFFFKPSDAKQISGTGEMVDKQGFATMWNQPGEAYTEASENRILQSMVSFIPQKEGITSTGLAAIFGSNTEEIDKIESTLNALPAGATADQRSEALRSLVAEGTINERGPAYNFIINKAINYAKKNQPGEWQSMKFDYLGQRRTLGDIAGMPHMRLGQAMYGMMTGNLLSLQDQAYVHETVPAGVDSIVDMIRQAGTSLYGKDFEGNMQKLTALSDLAHAEVAEESLRETLIEGTRSLPVRASQAYYAGRDMPKHFDNPVSMFGINPNIMSTVANITGTSQYLLSGNEATERGRREEPKVFEKWAKGRKRSNIGYAERDTSQLSTGDIRYDVNTELGEVSFLGRPDILEYSEKDKSLTVWDVKTKKVNPDYQTNSEAYRELQGNEAYRHQLSIYAGGLEQMAQSMLTTGGGRTDSPEFSAFMGALTSSGMESATSRRIAEQYISSGGAMEFKAGIIPALYDKDGKRVGEDVAQPFNITRASPGEIRELARDIRINARGNLEKIGMAFEKGIGVFPDQKAMNQQGVSFGIRSFGVGALEGGARQLVQGIRNIMSGMGGKNFATQGLESALSDLSNFSRPSGSGAASGGGTPAGGGGAAAGGGGAGDDGGGNEPPTASSFSGPDPDWMDMFRKMLNELESINKKFDGSESGGKGFKGKSQRPLDKTPILNRGKKEALKRVMESITRDSDELWRQTAVAMFPNEDTADNNAAAVAKLDEIASSGKWMGNFQKITNTAMGSDASAQAYNRKFGQIRTGNLGLSRLALVYGAVVNATANPDPSGADNDLIDPGRRFAQNQRNAFMATVGTVLSSVQKAYGFGSKFGVPTIGVPGLARDIAGDTYGSQIDMTGVQAMGLLGMREFTPQALAEKAENDPNFVNNVDVLGANLGGSKEGRRILAMLDDKNFKRISSASGREELLKEASKLPGFNPEEFQKRLTTLNALRGLMGIKVGKASESKASFTSLFYEQMDDGTLAQSPRGSALLGALRGNDEEAKGKAFARYSPDELREMAFHARRYVGGLDQSGYADGKLSDWDKAAKAIENEVGPKGIAAFVKRGGAQVDEAYYRDMERLSDESQNLSGIRKTLALGENLTPAEKTALETASTKFSGMGGLNAFGYLQSGDKRRAAEIVEKYEIMTDRERDVMKAKAQSVEADRVVAKASGKGSNVDLAEARAKAATADDAYSLALRQQSSGVDDLVSQGRKFKAEDIKETYQSVARRMQQDDQAMSSRLTFAAASAMSFEGSLARRKSIEDTLGSTPEMFVAERNFKKSQAAKSSLVGEFKKHYATEEAGLGFTGDPSETRLRNIVADEKSEEGKRDLAEKILAASTGEDEASLQLEQAKEAGKVSPFSRDLAKSISARDTWSKRPTGLSAKISDLFDRSGVDKFASSADKLKKVAAELGEEFEKLHPSLEKVTRLEKERTAIFEGQRADAQKAIAGQNIEKILGKDAVDDAMTSLGRTNLSPIDARAKGAVIAAEKKMKEIALTGVPTAADEEAYQGLHQASQQIEMADKAKAFASLQTKGFDIGGTARRLLGGFGLMYMRSIWGLATQSLGTGYEEGVSYRQSSEMALAQQYGGAVSTPEAERSRYMATAFGGGGESYKNAALFNLMRSNTGGYYASQYGVTFGSTFGASAWMMGEAFPNMKNVGAIAAGVGGAATLASMYANYAGATNPRMADYTSAAIAGRQLGGSWNTTAGGWMTNIAVSAGAGAGIGAGIGAPTGVGAPIGAAVGAGIGAVNGVFTSIGLYDPQKQAYAFNRDIREEAKNIKAMVDIRDQSGYGLANQLSWASTDERSRYTQMVAQAVSAQHTEWDPISVLKTEMFAERYGRNMTYSPDSYRRMVEADMAGQDYIGMGRASLGMAGLAVPTQEGFTGSYVTGMVGKIPTAAGRELYTAGAGLASKLGIDMNYYQAFGEGGTLPSTPDEIAKFSESDLQRKLVQGLIAGTPNESIYLKNNQQSYVGAYLGWEASPVIESAYTTKVPLASLATTPGEQEYLSLRAKMKDGTLSPDDVNRLKDIRGADRESIEAQLAGKTIIGEDVYSQKEISLQDKAKAEKASDRVSEYQSSYSQLKDIYRARGMSEEDISAQVKEFDLTPTGAPEGGYIYDPVRYGRMQATSMAESQLNQMYYRIGGFSAMGNIRSTGSMAADQMRGSAVQGIQQSMYQSSLSAAPGGVSSIMSFGSSLMSSGASQQQLSELNRIFNMEGNAPLLALYGGTSENMEASRSQIRSMKAKYPDGIPLIGGGSGEIRYNPKFMGGVNSKGQLTGGEYGMLSLATPFQTLEYASQYMDMGIEQKQAMQYGATAASWFEASRIFGDPGSNFSPMNIGSGQTPDMSFWQKSLGTYGAKYAQAYAEGGQMGLQAQYQKDQAGFAMAGAGIQFAQIALQEKYQPMFWAIEDKQRQLGHQYQKQQFKMQERSLEFSDSMFWKQRGIQEEQVGLTRKWAQEDWDYQGAMRSMQWQWKQEDFQENIRYASGRERRLGERQMQRETTMFNAEGDQIEKQKSRQEEMWKLEDERFVLEKEQHLESMTMQRKQLVMQKEYYFERYELESKQIKLQREYWKEQIELQKRSAGVSAAAAKASSEYADTQLMIAQGFEENMKSGGVYDPQVWEELGTLMGLVHLSFQDFKKDLIEVKKLIDAIVAGGGSNAVGGYYSPGNMMAEFGAETLVAEGSRMRVEPTFVHNPWQDALVANTKNQGGGSPSSPTTVIINVGGERLKEFVIDTISKEVSV